VRPHSVEETAQDWRQCQSEHRDRYGGEDRPEQERVPLPQPELTGQIERMFSRSVKEFIYGERHRRGVEDSAGCVDEWDDQDEFEWVDDVVADLRGGYVEAEDEGQSEAEKRSASEDGIDADEKAGGDTPGKLFRRSSHAEKRKDGKSDAAVDPVVVDGSLA
jgi:hypothetical protein